ncbi:uncharacterized protein LAESUDRAFT_715981 [Laetiporus sulphureus 93-53]|uniref:Uncharacterized protein n=1 Tax=Laetiporus sulphureus 93-53 TaxID=1314785 RepID=A0A165CZR9_9APHY|nr:uncharacterized protein LAESUDRAFT_715981 [Laetiporus sulphureus 93-53]KZT03839.1 hypothetical protein LAESUDRAFT_715981 [Laetiporus sulphureus 93-53]
MPTASSRLAIPSPAASYDPGERNQGKQEAYRKSIGRPSSCGRPWRRAAQLRRAMGMCRAHTGHMGAASFGILAAIKMEDEGRGDSEAATRTSGWNRTPADILQWVAPGSPFVVHCIWSRSEAALIGCRWTTTTAESFMGVQFYGEVGAYESQIGTLGTACLGHQAFRSQTEGLLTIQRLSTVFIPWLPNTPDWGQLLSESAVVLPQSARSA